MCCSVDTRSQSAGYSSLIASRQGLLNELLGLREAQGSLERLTQRHLGADAEISQKTLDALQELETELGLDM